MICFSRVSSSFYGRFLPRDLTAKSTKFNWQRRHNSNAHYKMSNKSGVCTSEMTECEYFLATKLRSEQPVAITKEIHIIKDLSN